MPSRVSWSLTIGSCVIAVLLAGSTMAIGRPHLSQSEVVAFAEARARRVLRDTRLTEYRYISVRYFEDKHAWCLGYQHKRVPSTWFDVVVDDRTREAAVVME